MTGDDEHLANMLRAAEADVRAAPVSSQGLATRAIALSHQRKRRRRMAGGVLVSGALCLLLWLPTRNWYSGDFAGHPTKPGITGPEHVADVTGMNPGAAQLRAELAALEREAAERQRVVAGLLQSDRLRRAAEQLRQLERSAARPVVPPDVSARCEAEVAAEYMVHYAETMARNPRRKEDAHAELRRVMALFPETVAARAAMSRL